MKTNLTTNGKIVIGVVMFLIILSSQYILINFARDFSVKSMVSLALVTTIIITGTLLLMEKQEKTN